MKPSVLATLAWLCAGTVATAQQMSEFTLDNGLQVVVIEDHRSAAVTHTIWYRVGAADEQPGRSGIAHFLEHLMYMGTNTVKSGEYDEIVEAQGGEEGIGETGRDYTLYSVRIAADRLDMIMRLEADRMRNLSLSESDVASERKVILEERNERIDNDPISLLWEQVMAAQYQNHRYGVSVLGWRHEMERLDRQQALDFYRQYYAPNNAILVVAGDVTPDQVHDMARTHYGPLAPTPGLGPRHRSSEPPQLAERRILMSDPRSAEPFLVRSTLAPERDPGNQSRAAALTVLAELLGGDANSSVLARALTYGTAQASYVAAFYTPVALDRTTFELELSPAEGVSLAVAEAAMDAALQQFLAQGADPDEVRRIKTRLRGQEIYDRDSTATLARTIGEALTVGLTLDDIRSWPAALEAVTPEDVTAAARDVLDRRQSVTGHLVISEESAP